MDDNQLLLVGFVIGLFVAYLVWCAYAYGESKREAKRLKDNKNIARVVMDCLYDNKNVTDKEHDYVRGFMEMLK